MSSVGENIKLTRRSFLKMAALSSLATPLLARSETLREVSADELKEAYEGSKKVKTVCTACSVGCGIIAEVQKGVWVRQEIAQDHPVSSGGHCCKGSDMIDMVRSHVRLKYPMKKENGEWKRISYEQALSEIGEKLAAYRKENPESVMFLGSAKLNNEQAYYIRKFAAFFGTNNVDHQARI
ncbi:hypothetical protein DT098_07895 [Campylobacter jejuni]|nr:hypothetical protein [Campylobacter jejuni]